MGFDSWCGTFKTADHLPFSTYSEWRFIHLKPEHKIALALDDLGRSHSKELPDGTHKLRRFTCRRPRPPLNVFGVVIHPTKKLGGSFHVKQPRSSSLVNRYGLKRQEGTTGE